MDRPAEQSGPTPNPRAEGSLAPFVGGRCFRGGQRVRLGDVDAGGRARLDSLARYLQDVANDDAYDSGIDNPGVWVVRRTTLEVYRRPVLREDLELTTFCSGTGACWAERRTTITGSEAAHIEAAVLWVQLDLNGTRPARLGPDFMAVYGESAAGRKVRANLVADPEPPPGPARSYPLRATDVDVMGHVNNAIYWGMLDEVLRQKLQPDEVPVRFNLEHHQPIDPGAAVELSHRDQQLWISAAGSVAAVATWNPLRGSVDQSIAQ